LPSLLPVMELVVLDVLLPGMSGLDVCRTLRADAATAATAVLIVSASGLTGDLDAGRAAGHVDRARFIG
jgi:CheY-like chemotaxis protein